MSATLGSSPSFASGGGGGSYLVGTASNAVLIGGANSGNGLVTIAQLALNLLVGNNASYQSTNFMGVSYVYNNIFIGCNEGDSNNSVSVINTGTFLNATANFIVGQNGSDNGLSISNGGSVLNSGAGVIGLNAAAAGNSVLVTGTGSTWSNAGALLIGNSGSGNSLAIQAGGQVLEGGVGTTLGYNAYSSNNSLLIDGSGSILISSTDLVVGYAGNSNSVVISNGGIMTNGQLSFGGVIGLYAGSSNNSVVVTGTGSSWNNAGDLLVGWDDSGNNLTITNGGTANNSQINYGGAIGFNVGSSNNSVVVTGSASSWSNSGDLLLGVNGSSNSVVISNGGTVASGQVNYGGVIGFNSGSTNNSILVAGTGSTWSNIGDLLVGVGGSSNSMVITNGGTVTNAQVNYGGVIGLYVGANDNSVLITGTGSTWNNSGDLTVGWNGSSNSLVVSGGGSVTNGQSNNGAIIGLNIDSSNNSVVIAGAGSTWKGSGDLQIGSSGSGNSLVISNGATVGNGQVSYGGVIGLGATSSNNSVLVTGSGSTWSNSGNLQIGYDGSSNSLVVAAGAVVSTVVNAPLNYGGVIGLNSDSSNNRVLVTGNGSTWTNSGNLTIGNAGTGNSLTVANGGSAVAGAVIIGSSAGSSGTLNIGSLGGSDTAGAIITPTITFGSGSGTINFNQVDTATVTNAISGNGSVNQLGSGATILSGSNNYTGTTTVSGGTLMANNTSGSAVGTSSVNVNGGTLGGTGIIVGATTISSGGTLAAGEGGSGNLTFMSGLSLESGSTTSFTIHSANDFTSIYMVGNTVNYGGQLFFDIASYNPIAGNVFKVFNMIGGAGESGNFFSVEIGRTYLTGLNGLWSGTNAGATYQFDEATGQLSVCSLGLTSEVPVDSIPEPSTYTLLGLGVLGMLIALRRRWNSMLQ